MKKDIKLTFKNKTLSYDEKRDIEALKRYRVLEQGNCCCVCDKPFGSDRLPEMAHMISKANRNIKKYGYEVIHHYLNIKITCSDCNSSVLINTSKTVLVNDHINKILEELKNN
jgi:hypothetical protein